MRSALAIGLALLAVGLAGCPGFEECPRYGPYAVWTDQALFRHMLASSAPSGEPGSWPSEQATAVAGVTLAVARMGPSGSLGRLDAMEAEALWGGAAVDEVALDLGDGAALRLANDRAITATPYPAKPSEAQARAFLDAVLDEPEDARFDFAHRLAVTGWLAICEASCDGQGYVRPTAEGSALHLRLDAFFAERRPWTLAGPAPPEIDEGRSRTGFEQRAELASDVWHLVVRVPTVQAWGHVGDQPYDLQVAADGVAEFHVANQPWGQRQEPKPRPEQVLPLLDQVFLALAWPGGVGSDVQQGAGDFSVGCIY